MNNLSESVKRVDWLDVLKCIAMFIVLCGHVSRDNTPDTIRYYIYSFHMPLFFIISGMGFYLQTQKEYSFMEMVKNKSRSLLRPYLALNIIMIPLWLFNFKFLTSKEESITELLLAILYSNQKWNSLPTSTTWFITTLFLVTMLFFVIKSYFNDDEKLIVIACMVVGLIGYAVSLNPSDDFFYPWHLDTVPIGCMLFMGGYVFMKNIDFFELILGSKWYHRVAWILGLFCAGYCCARYNVKISMAVNSYGSFILFIGSVIAFSMICYIISRIIPNINVLKLIGRNTIVYLAIHEQIYRTLQFFSEETRCIIDNYPYITATAVFILLIPVAYIFERWFPWAIGKRKRKYI